MAAGPCDDLAVVRGHVTSQTEVVCVTGKPCSHRHAVDADNIVHPSAHPPLAEREEFETEDSAVLTTPHVFLPRPTQWNAVIAGHWLCPP